jgi:xylulokinase
MVVLDRSDRILRPAKLWNDTTSFEYAHQLISALGREEWATRVGSVPNSSLTIAKVAWFAAREPELFAQLSHLMLPHDWLTFQLTGLKTTDRADASGTGYFNLVDNRWRPDVLELVDSTVDWELMLPVVMGPDQSAGFADTARAAELGLDSRTLVGCGTGDQAAAALALGTKPGDIVVSLGTSGTVYGQSPFPVIDPTGFVEGAANATGGFQPIVVTLNAAKVTDTFGRLMGVNHEELSSLAIAADQSIRDRPLLASFLDTERSPDRPNSRGLLGGLSSTTSREELALAAFEGVVLGLHRGFVRLRELGVDASGRLLITGGAAKSQGYQRVIANIFSHAVSMSTTNGSLDSARGAAIQAAAVLRNATVASVSHEWAPATPVVVEPETRTSGFLEGLLERYERIADVEALDGMWSIV